MSSNDKQALIAAAIIFAGFSAAAYFMPTLMLALGDISPVLAGIVGTGFVLAFFLVFWLRARSRR
ncbi:MAG: hypothetical protein WAT78_09955 [Rhizobiaceae bacterium]